MRDLVKSLARRWYLVVAGVIATLALCMGATWVVPATYETHASVVFLPPPTSVVQGGNPYLQLGGLNQVVDVVARSLSSQQVAAEMKAEDAASTFEVVRDLTTSGPILALTVEGRTMDRASLSLKALLARVPSTLTSLQNSLDIGPKSQISSMVLTQDESPEAVTRARLRAVVAAAGVGLLVTLMIVALIDSWLLRRSGSRRRTDQVQDRPQLLDDSLSESSDQSSNLPRSSISPPANVDRRDHPPDVVPVVPDRRTAESVALEDERPASPPNGKPSRQDRSRSAGMRTPPRANPSEEAPAGAHADAPHGRVGVRRKHRREASSETQSDKLQVASATGPNRAVR